MTSKDIRKIPEIVRDLYSVVNQLERACPHRSFTPDGHLVGSIGEVVAEHEYGLSLLPQSTEAHDATAPDGRLVQIKATQGTRVSLSSKPNYLLVLKLFKNGSIEEIYNGPGKPAWKAAGKKQKNGQRQISLTRLQSLAKDVAQADRLSKRNDRRR